MPYSYIVDSFAYGISSGIGFYWYVFLFINYLLMKMNLKTSFIPCYTSLLREWYTATDAIVYGFIDLWLDWDSFYFYLKDACDLLAMPSGTFLKSLERFKKDWKLDCVVIDLWSWEYSVRVFKK